MPPYGVINSLETTWETPYEIIAWLDKSYQFTTDLCASDENRLCEEYFTKENSCLDHEWRGRRCFMNPPYGKEMVSMLAKAVKTWEEGKCCIVALLPARTDTGWFHDYILGHSSVLTFIRRRVRFDRGGKPVAEIGPIGHMICVWASDSPGDWRSQRQIINSVDYKAIKERYL